MAFTFNRYAHRNKVLKGIGFDSYSDYLKSDLWASIKKRVLKRDKGKCQSCRQPATSVHHKHYSKRVLLGEHIIGLKAICKECHQKIEFDKDGSKNDVVTANRAMRKIGETNGTIRPFCSICHRNPTKRNSSICGKCKKDLKNK